MNNERRVNIGEPAPHFDGRRESPITDPDGGTTMGIRSDINPNFPLENNPFHITNEQDEDTEKLNQLINGDKVKQDD